jgi:hypothetical protein
MGLPAPTEATSRVGAAAAVPTWLAPVAVGAGALGLCVLAGLTDSSDRWLPSCPFKESTGLDCPGCGMTRGLRNLAQGDLVQAADHNLLLLVALPFLLVAWLAWLGRDLGLTTARPLTWTWRPLAPVVTGAILGFWALRLVPFAPFDWLASGA